jgi:hypothetical protein
VRIDQSGLSSKCFACLKYTHYIPRTLAQSAWSKDGKITIVSVNIGYIFLESTRRLGCIKFDLNDYLAGGDMKSASKTQ